MKYLNINSMVKRSIILLLGFVLMLSGCKKFLEEIPTGSLTTKSTYSTQADVDALTVGPYRNLINWTAGAEDWGNILPNAVEYQTGFAYTMEPHVLFWRFQTNQVSGDLLGDFNWHWTYWYRGVQGANFSISQLQGITTISADNISKALGEVRTLRAWYYFCLVRYFGDVPMTTGALGSIDEAQQPRTSLKKIYDEVIIPDLEFAIASKLPDAASSNGRITKYVSRALLADVYLTVAGYPYQEVATDPEKDWCVDGGWTMSAYPVNTTSAKDFLQKAKTQLDALYGKYTLGTYADLRDPAMNNKGEAIFQAQYLAGVNNNGLIQCTFPLTSHISMFGDENGTYLASPEYYNSYSDADKRKQEGQFWFTRDNISKRYDPTEPLGPPFDRPYLYKFYDESAVKVTGTSGLNWTFYRYADVLLMLTEVNWALRQFSISVTDNDIIKGINEVRTRALLPGYLVGEVNLLTIMSERAYELIFENKMLWDQRRTRMCLKDGVGSFSEIRSFFGHRPTSFSFNFSAMNLLSPMPGNEIIRNLTVKQNFGFLPKQVGQ